MNIILILGNIQHILLNSLIKQLREGERETLEFQVRCSQETQQRELGSLKVLLAFGSPKRLLHWSPTIPQMRYPPPISIFLCSALYFCTSLSLSSEPLVMKIIQGLKVQKRKCIHVRFSCLQQTMGDGTCGLEFSSNSKKSKAKVGFRPISKAPFLHLRHPSHSICIHKNKKKKSERWVNLTDCSD